jgi:hypothetical protein
MSYFKPNTKKAIKIATAIKGLTTTLATAAFVTSSANYTLIILIVGAAANELINFLSDAEDPKSKI